MLHLDLPSFRAGKFIVSNNGNPLCDLNPDVYPPEILPNMQAEYDALCGAIESGEAGKWAVEPPELTPFAREKAVNLCLDYLRAYHAKWLPERALESGMDPEDIVDAIVDGWPNRSWNYVCPRIKASDTAVLNTLPDWQRVLEQF